jgi:hypothetical protein
VSEDRAGSPAAATMELDECDHSGEVILLLPFGWGKPGRRFMVDRLAGVRSPKLRCDP